MHPLGCSKRQKGSIETWRAEIFVPRWVSGAADTAIRTSRTIYSPCREPNAFITAIAWSNYNALLK